MSTLKNRITNTLKSYSNGSAALVALIPPMIEHIASSGDTSSTFERVLNGVEKKDAARIRAITIAVLGEKAMNMTFGKDTQKWAVKLPNGKAGFHTDDNALPVLESLIGDNVRLHSPMIDAALFNAESAAKAFDLNKRALALVKKAFGEHIPAAQVEAAIRAAFAELADKAPAEDGVTVEEAVVIEEQGRAKAA